MSAGKLPEGWVITTFTELLDVQGGTQPPKSEFISEMQDGYVRLLQIRDFGNKPVPTYIPDTSKLKKCKEEDLLIGRYGASLGRICTGHAGAYNVALAKVIIPKQLERSFVRYYLESEIFQFPLRLLSRSAQNGFNKDDLSKFNFVLVPLSEQKIIAEKLDTLLAQVDSAKARLEQIPQILKRFRQAVLGAAVSGNLTEAWRRKNNFNFDNWEKLTLGHIVKKIEAGKNLKCIEIPPDNHQYGIIKISAVTWGEYDEEESKTLPDNSLFIESRRISVGDFLISRANTLELLGNPVIVKQVTKNLMLSDKVLRLVMEDYDKPWINIFLRSFYGRREIEFRSTGNQLSMRNIGQKALLEIPIPKPPIKEQHEIVRRVEQLFAYADTIEKQVNNALARVNNLTQSILAKAFRGELTAQWRAENPELISGENSAAALLEKIKAERAASGGKKASRKKS
ncbi:restriction endonuclease subunit S [Escherichia fergusonii]|uniref:restriction endonuclease subunit S n=1 Tax=Escherichia fergusonii TaxID=564 RepID=UPI0015EF7819|nr:restriction endonuclease subunit S [Escherichia fergusonii]MBA8273936.1 restriction endonuclease subunit S [Escherichia fergusonii]QMI02491.1 restriction endonuclease subunit S [Escherichia fergusonii]